MAKMTRLVEEDMLGDLGMFTSADYIVLKLKVNLTNYLFYFLIYGIKLI